MIRRKLGVILAAFIFSISLFAGNLVNPQGIDASCSQASITLYTDSGFNGDALTICFNGHGSGVTGLPSWINNKVSSVKTTNSMPYAYDACLYDAINYNGLVLELRTPNSYQWYAWDWGNDKTTSVRFMYYTSNCQG